LGSNAPLQRALEHWQPHFIDWWKKWGRPLSATQMSICAPPPAIDAEGWASYGMVKMPDYRWGIFSRRAGVRSPDRLAMHWASRCGSRFGRASLDLRRLIVTQGDTERPQSSSSAARQNLPSLYDLRNLFQINVEEGRHLWAMVYCFTLILAEMGARKRRAAGAPFG